MPDLTAEQRIAYGKAVWSNFQNKAKSRRQMSSAEWLVITRWMNAEIPLWTVLRGINDFEGKPRRLEAVVQSVERVHAYGLQAVPRGEPK